MSSVLRVPAPEAGTGRYWLRRNLSYPPTPNQTSVGEGKAQRQMMDAKIVLVRGSCVEAVWVATFLGNGPTRTRRRDFALAPFGYVHHIASMAQKHPKRPRNVNQRAERVVDLATMDADELREFQKDRPAKQTKPGRDAPNNQTPGKRGSAGK